MATHHITRIELFSAEPEHFNILHEAMKTEGFRDKIYGVDCVWYKLPPAVYDNTDDLHIDNIKGKAIKAIEKTGCKYTLLISKSDHVTWEGLDPI
jgi:hypothetical protein